MTDAMLAAEAGTGVPVIGHFIDGEPVVAK